MLFDNGNKELSLFFCLGFRSSISCCIRITSTHEETFLRLLLMPGAPALPNNLASFNPVGVRYLPAQLDLIDQAAQACKLPRASFIREGTMEYARRILSQAS